MNYFDHEYISASDLKSFLKKLGGGFEEPANLQAIFDLGTLIHSTILEPHKIDLEMSVEDRELALKMSKTFFKDPLCRMFVMREDFRREDEHYDTVTVGGMTYASRCKCDGRSAGISSILELKGLNVTTEKAFLSAIDTFNYDLSACHYMLTTGDKMQLIVGISKKNPELLFKKIIKKHDESYAVGEEKLIETIRLLREFSPEDVQLVA